ncbi:hypothetical protein EBQ91_02100 [bacterium]|nr:hypothetical protein [bacterium]
MPTIYSNIRVEGSPALVGMRSIGASMQYDGDANHRRHMKKNAGRTKKQATAYRVGFKKMRTQTRKHHQHQINGKIFHENNQGWKTVHVWGEPFERGFAHGALLYKDLARIKKSLPFMVKTLINIKFSEYMAATKQIIVPIVKTYPEYYQEIRGISAGASQKRLDISTDFLIGWNAFLSLYSHFIEGKSHTQKIERCSAFIATGNATKNGDIVMAHTTHSDLITGQLLNIVLKVTPTNGHEFVMQTSAGLIASTSDWYISKSGIVCCETTIADISYSPKFGVPFFLRIREAIQYASTLDDCIYIMTNKNAGDYSCSWLFGDTKTGEIMLLELGLATKNIRRTTNGVFYGMNSAIGQELRTLETTDTDFHNIESLSGNRNYRLNYLLNTQYYGRIDSTIAKKIMGDHYDMVLGKQSMNRRVICKHPELDIASLYKPYSCTDGKVLTTSMAKNLKFLGIFGSGCGKREFKKREYIREHPEYKEWGSHLEDMPMQKWVVL